MAEFLLFSASFPDAKFEEKLEDLKRDKVFSFVKNARSVCWVKMFDYAPVDKGGIEKIAFSYYGKPKSVSEIASILSSIKPGVLEGQLRQFVKAKPAESVDLENVKKAKGDAVDFAFAYFFFCLWKSVFPESVSFAGKGNPSAKEVRFAAHTADWTAVKKVDLGKAEDKEVLFALAGVFNTLNRKLPKHAADDAEGFESFVSSFLNSFPLRKSFAKLPVLLNEALKNEEKIPQFGSSPSLKELFFLRCFEHAGFPPFVSLDAIAGVYPELKIPKPRGNFGGGKKK
ncbi:MAG: hypothetical protein QXR53_00895 [Candidatus Norongarragalinales archaeon]